MSKNPARDAEIIRLLQTGEHTLQSVANICKLSKQWVWTIAVRNGIRGHRFQLLRRRNAEKRAAKAPSAQVISDYCSGTSLQKIGAKYRISRDTVKQLLIDNGIKLRRYSERGYGETTRRIIELSTDGCGPTEISEELGISELYTLGLDNQI